MWAVFIELGVIILLFALVLWAVHKGRNRK